MLVEAYLIIKKNDSYRGVNYTLRVTKEKPNLNSSEIALLLRLDIPKEFFDRLTPTIDIKLPKEAVITSNIETVIKITAEEVAKNLQLDVIKVEDGLKEMLQDKQEN